MGYIKSTLIQDEKIESIFSIHWWFYIQNILFCWLIVPLFWLIKLLFTEYGLTNKRVITKSGIISRDTDEMKLDKIETVEIKQGILGRILGYGNVICTGTGVSSVIFQSVSNPIKVKKQIDTVLSQN
tara:strand:- start:637 stop:1017 length:381 start_codon:yes stop_codon:yes gene_type:complete